MAKASTRAKNQSNAQKAKAAHETASKQRASDQAALKGAYRAGDGEVILEDLRKKILLWQSLNNKVAQDGVGSRPTGHKLVDGSQEQEYVYLTPTQRASYLDQSKGQQAILDYIDRMLEAPKPKAKKENATA